MGRGRMGGPYSAGPGGACVCSKCGYQSSHKRGVPCTKQKCPKCGSSMARKISKSAKLDAMRKRGGD